MSRNKPPLSRKALSAEMDAIVERNRSRWKNDGTSSSLIAQARSEMARNIKADIELGTYDEQVSAAQDFYVDTIRARWHQLTPRQKKRLYQIDSLLQISIRQLSGPMSIQANEPLDSTRLVPQTIRKSSWYWPLVTLSAFLATIIGGAALSLMFPA